MIARPSARFMLLTELAKDSAGLRSSQIEHMGIHKAILTSAGKRGLVRKPADSGGNWTITDKGASYLAGCCSTCGEPATALRGRFTRRKR